MKITADMELKDIPEEKLAEYENKTPFFERSEIISVLDQYKIELKKIIKKFLYKKNYMKLIY